MKRNFIFVLATIMTKINKKEIFATTAKSIFGVVPFGGALLDELFFEYNGRIKQNRLNNFVQILADNFTEDAEINLDNIKTEDFNDLFEAVLRRVVQTKSQTKLLRFKDILIKELNKPSEESELIDVYLDLISSLSEQELIVLFHHQYFDDKFNLDFEKKNKLKEQRQKLEQKLKEERLIIDISQRGSDKNKFDAEIKEIEKRHMALDKFRTAEFYGIDEQRFVYYKQRLFSKGLVIDWGIGRIGVRPFEMMSITEFGTEFIEFIKSGEN
ncbi:hypothetical protein MBM09_12970 [Flaviramulus sp. BrNp1-15]|uniref:hypothetical protein n=1 Tax=Flaviramulus sp. BrNp1-15 TaxID=2916754 RepID=UPI001EE7BC2B|nr:hypothetical protein [Flaviramulus sp. BrNp1-15]ULC58820.1 hypothetical protein MBM09_12970 [Flaviramulus sp. BrNp1-15]